MTQGGWHGTTREQSSAPPTVPDCATTPSQQSWTEVSPDVMTPVYTTPHTYIPAPRRSGVDGALILLVALLLIAAGSTFAAHTIQSTTGWKQSMPGTTPSLRSTATPTPSTRSTRSPSPTPARDWATTASKNPLYSVSYPLGVTCDAQPSYEDAAGAGQFMEALAKCFEQGWREQLLKRNLPARQATFRYYETKSVATLCGSTERKVPFFCPSDRTVYVPQQFAQQVVDSRPVMAVAAIAHEMAHYAQYESGIMTAAHRLESRDQASKRVELQALCSQYAAIMFSPDFSAYRGDLMRLEFLETEDHGSTESMQYWLEKGMASAKFADCNTFTAPLSKVN